MEEMQRHVSVIRYLVSVVVLTILGAGGYHYYLYQKKYPSTDDAYIHGRITFIASEVGGRLKSVPVHDYQLVHKGEVLFLVDPEAFKAKLSHAKAAYLSATQANKADDSKILAASEMLTAATAALHDTQLKYKRILELTTRGSLPLQDADNARAELADAQAHVAVAKDNMTSLVVAQGAKGAQASTVQQAAADLLLAGLSLSYTSVTAPQSGQLGIVHVHEGSVVSPGQALTPLVQADSYWIAANYKESDLGRIKSGMPATIHIAMYPSQTFKGHVSGISPASGSSFSLLPPENASGNWVKVTQRFPVSIAFDSGNNTQGHPLRVGSSATVSIDTVAAGTVATDSIAKDRITPAQ